MNTGMNRLGFTPAQYREAYHRLHSAGYKLTHMTHFANADYIDRAPSVDQQVRAYLMKRRDGLARRDLFIQLSSYLVAPPCHLL
jgi:alanine racemase